MESVNSGTQKTVCILHTESKVGNEEVKQFDHETWSKVQRANDLRKQKPKWKSSKYAAVCDNLLGDFSETDGYHTQCYKNFTAIPYQSDSISKPSSNPDDTPKVLLRSQIDHPIASSSGIFERTCLFCGNVVKRVGKRREQLGLCESREAEININQAASVLNDNEMTTKIGSIDFVAKEVRYHHTCRKAYINRADNVQISDGKVKPNTEPDCKIFQRAHEIAFDEIKTYVQTNLITNNKAELLTSLHERYMSYMAEQGSCDTSYKAQTFGQKLMKHFQGKLKMGKINNRQGNVVFSSSIEKGDAVKIAMQQACSIESKNYRGWITFTLTYISSTK